MDLQARMPYPLRAGMSKCARAGADSFVYVRPQHTCQQTHADLGDPAQSLRPACKSCTRCRLTLNLALLFSACFADALQRVQTEQLSLLCEPTREELAT